MSVDGAVLEILKSNEAIINKGFFGSYFKTNLGDTHFADSDNGLYVVDIAYLTSAGFLGRDSGGYFERTDLVLVDMETKQAHRVDMFSEQHMLRPFRKQVHFSNVSVERLDDGTINVTYKAVPKRGPFAFFRDLGDEFFQSFVGIEDSDYSISRTIKLAR